MNNKYYIYLSNFISVSLAGFQKFREERAEALIFGLKSPYILFVAEKKLKTKKE